MPPKDTPAELRSDVSSAAQTGEDRGGDPRSSKLANPLLRRWVDLPYEP